MPDILSEASHHTLVVTNDFPPRTGGIEAFAYEMVRRFPPETVTVLTSSEPGSAAHDADLPFEVVRLSTRVLLPTPGLVRAAASLALERESTSIWFASAAPLAVIARNLRRLTGVQRIVATSHGHEVGWAKLPGGRQALRRIGDSVDALTCLADYTRDRIAGALSPAAVRRMVALPPGTNLKDMGGAPADGNRARAQHGLGAGPVVLSVSRLVARKGQDQLIRAWPQISAGFPGSQLVIVGSGPREDALRAQAAASPASSSIVITGWQPESALADLYDSASVFAIPCRSRRTGLEVEGLGIVFLEAQAAGVPVVVGRSGGAPAAVLDGESGFVVDGTDVDDIATAIEALLADPGMAARMGGRGRDWVASSCTWQSRHETLARLLGRAT